VTLDPKQRSGLPTGDAKFLEIIDKFGWHVMSVAPRVEEEGESFSYSTGLYLRFKHPEILLCGLNSSVSTRIINAIGEEIRRGKSFGIDQDYSGIFANGVKCRFRRVVSDRCNEYVCWAQWFYEHEEFPVLQCFWPDKKGRYPWETGCQPEIVQAQPLLFHHASSIM
jgi:hypothetical protein